MAKVPMEAHDSSQIPLQSRLSSPHAQSPGQDQTPNLLTNWSTHWNPTIVYLEAGDCGQHLHRIQSIVANTFIHIPSITSKINIFHMFSTSQLFLLLATLCPLSILVCFCFS